MKRTNNIFRKTKILAVIFCILLTGCRLQLPRPDGGRDDLKEKDVQREWLRIRIINATDTPNGVYYKQYEFENKKGDGKKKNPEISKENRDYLLSYVEKLDDTRYYKNQKGTPEPISDEAKNHHYLGTVDITYVAKGEDVKKSNTRNYERDIFDEFPEGYDEFIKLLNELDKENPIIISKPFEMNADTYKKVTGLTDDMVNDGTIEDILKAYPVSLYALMQDYANNYGNYYSNPDKPAPAMLEYWPLYRAYPKTQKSAESTEEELVEFARQLAPKICMNAEDCQLNKQGYVSMHTESGMLVDVFRTCAIPDEYEYEDYPLVLVSRQSLDGGEYIKDFRRTFFYSKDYKFAVCLNGSEKRSYYGETYSSEQLYRFYMDCSELLASS